MRIAIVVPALVLLALSGIDSAAPHSIATPVAHGFFVEQMRGRGQNSVDRTYRAADPAGVITLHWGETRGRLSGVIQLLTFPGGHGSARLYTGPGAWGGMGFTFTGTRTREQLLLNVNDGSATSTWTGMFTGTLLKLNVPSEEMVMRTVRPHVSLPTFHEFIQPITLEVGPGSTTVS